MPSTQDDAKREPNADALGENLSVEDVLKGLGGLLGAVAKMEEAGMTEPPTREQIESLPQKPKGLFGLSLKIGVGGHQSEKHVFGALQDSAGEPEQTAREKRREPVVEMFVEPDRVLLVCELPGVEEDQIQCTLEDGALTIAAEGGSRKYRVQPQLPVSVAGRHMQSSYRNGVLHVTLQRA